MPANDRAQCLHSLYIVAVYTEIYNQSGFSRYHVLSILYSYFFSLQDLTRLSRREWNLDGKRALRYTRKPFGLSRVQPIYLSVSRPSEVYVSYIFKHNNNTTNQFHWVAVLSENKNFQIYSLISSLYCSFANVAPCPLVLLSSLPENKIFL